MDRRVVRRRCPAIMGGSARIVVVGDDAEVLVAAAREAETLLRDLQRRWTRFEPTSELRRLGAAGGRRTLVSPETLRLIVAMRDAFARTSGVFDPSVLPEVLARGGARSLVDPAAITVLPPDARRVPFTDVVVEAEAGAVTLPAGLHPDAGGIGKGLAADLVVERLLVTGATGALIEVDGDLRIAGDAPEPYGWVIDVEDPFAPESVLSRIAVEEAGIATSSTRRHRWPADAADGSAEAVHHLIGPAGSVAPPDDEPATVTVVTTSGADAEVLAKLPILLGERAGLARVLGLDPEASVLLVRPDRTTTTAGSWPVDGTEGAA